ncbi:MAG: septum formation protein Maf [Atopobiaceae bacterium]|nr:septum formation protein Maf [Atopobiaceae bacterium]
MILASASPRRSDLLGRLGFELEIRPADIDESRGDDEHPQDLVRRLAYEKAHCVFGQYGVGADGFLLAADTIVWHNDRALGKPVDADEAMSMLRELSGRVHHVSTGVSILYQQPGQSLRDETFVETTDVRFYDLSDSQIASYVQGGECVGKAGAYAIQGSGRLLVEGISGDYDNVVGLPVSRVVRVMVALAADDEGASLIERLLEEKHA